LPSRNEKPEFLGCWRKKPYTRREALAKIDSERVAEGVRLFMYQCPYDQEHRRRHWHLTRQPQTGAARSADEMDS